MCRGELCIPPSILHICPACHEEDSSMASNHKPCKWKLKRFFSRNKKKQLHYYLNGSTETFNFNKSPKPTHLKWKRFKDMLSFCSFFFFFLGACSITDNLAEGKSWLGLHPHHGKLGGMDDWPHKQVKTTSKTLILRFYNWGNRVKSALVSPCYAEDWWEQWGTEMLSCK